MRAAWVIGVSTALFAVGCAYNPEPRQVGEGDRRFQTAAPSPPPVPTCPAPEPSHEEVCRKLWSMIEGEARAAFEKAKATKAKGKLPRVPGARERREFLLDCLEEGAREREENPSRYACQRRCVLGSETTEEVDACGQTCP
jgi:hypothetical protein